MTTYVAKFSGTDGHFTHRYSNVCEVVIEDTHVVLLDKDGSLIALLHFHYLISLEKEAEHESNC